MKTLILLFIFSSLTACYALAQGTVEVMEAPELFKILFAIVPAKVQAITYKIIIFMGSARMILKPIVAAYLKHIESTPSKKDDAKLAKILNTKTGKVLHFLLDYFCSVKFKKPVKK